MLRAAKLWSLVVAFSVFASGVQAADECPVSKALGQLPKISFKVGDKAVCCSKAAANLAKEQASPITYVVAKKEFKQESDAQLALAEVTEKFVAKFAAPCKCEVSGKTTVAGKEVCCDVAAGLVAQQVKKAMDTVKVSYLVGEESVCCPKAAKALAAKTGKPIVHCIGDEKTQCAVSSRLAVARAKYKAAVQALVAAEKKEKNSTSKSKT